MGSCSIKDPSNVRKEISVHKSDFLILHPIGKGSFGRVWKIQNKKTNRFYAMKEMSKVIIYKKKAISSINQELHILSSLNNFFISNIHSAFQNEDNLYLIMDFFSGGDLRYHISKRSNKHFTEDETKFIICNLLTALIYLRQNKIIHRDIKPENLVFDEIGYVHLTDFGISKKIGKESVIVTSGTPSYMSPEAVLGKNQSYQSDYFSLGVLAYELIFGKRPYIGKTKGDIKRSLLCKSIKVEENDLPSYIKYNNKAAICDFVNKLLNRKAVSRIGANGIEEIMTHPWLEGFNWNELLNRKMKSPFVIRNEDNYDIEAANRKEMYIDECQYEDILYQVNKAKLFNHFKLNRECTENNIYCKKKNDIQNISSKCKIMKKDSINSIMSTKA